MRIAYARVSTLDQSTDLQIDALRKAGCEKIFTEAASGAKQDRPELTKLLEFARPGDTIVVWKLDRLARSMAQLIDTMEALNERGIALESLTEKIDTTTPQGKLFFGIFASLAEFERSLIRERVQAGLQAARDRGRMGGRPRVKPEKLKHAETLIRGGESVTQAAKLSGVSVATLKRYRSNLYRKGRCDQMPRNA